MQHSQLFTDLAHIAYAGFVPKKELDKIAGKPSWDPDNDSSIHAEDWPVEQGPFTPDIDLETE